MLQIMLEGKTWQEKVPTWQQRLMRLWSFRGDRCLLFWFSVDTSASRQREHHSLRNTAFSSEQVAASVNWWAVTGLCRGLTASRVNKQEGEWRQNKFGWLTHACMLAGKESRGRCRTKAGLKKGLWNKWTNKKAVSSQVALADWSSQLGQLAWPN